MLLFHSMKDEKAVQFCLLDQNGNQRCLKDFLGKWVLVYFYPKDNTPGCTKEACGLRDAWADLNNQGLVVLGISGDSQASHKKFEEKYKLPFILLSDPEKEVIKKYGVLKEKSMFGKKYMGISRESFLIDPKGVVVKHYDKVKPKIHAEEVLDDLKSFK